MGPVSGLCAGGSSTGLNSGLDSVVGGSVGPDTGLWPIGGSLGPGSGFGGGDGGTVGPDSGPCVGGAGGGGTVGRVETTCVFVILSCQVSRAGSNKVQKNPRPTGNKDNKLLKARTMAVP